MLIEHGSVGGPSDLGTAAHEALAEVIEGREPDLEIIALRHGVDLGELSTLVAVGRSAWNKLAPSYPNARTEVAVSADEEVTGQEGLRLVGHVDVLSEQWPEEARGIDWKSGRKEETDYYDQIAGYATCLILGHGFKRVVFSVVWLRSMSIETFTFTREDAVKFAARVAAALAPGASYRIGEHCPNCARSHNCPALIAAGRRDLALFAGADAGEIIAAAPSEQLVALRRKVRTLVSFAESLDDAIRRRVATDGPLDSGDGYSLQLVEENGKREIDTIKAWPVLQAALTDEELAPCITVSARAVDDAVAKKAGKGKGAAAKREIAAALEQAGALTQPKVTKLKEVRAPRALDNPKGEAA